MVDGSAGLDWTGHFSVFFCFPVSFFFFVSFILFEFTSFFDEQCSGILVASNDNRLLCHLWSLLAGEHGHPGPVVLLSSCCTSGIKIGTYPVSSKVLVIECAKV